MKILLVENDAGLLRTLGFGLARMGYQAETAGDGVTALDIIRSSRDAGAPVEFLITDLKMPGMMGVELIRESLHLLPGLAAILITGFGGDPAPDRDGRIEGFPCLEKPFALHELSGLIEEIAVRKRPLDEPRRPATPVAGVGSPESPHPASLAAANPELARQWHPTRNGSLAPTNVRAHSHKKIWWLCGQGHEWSATVDNRSKGSGCPYCLGRIAHAGHNLVKANPEVAREWHPSRNGELTANDVTPGSGKTVWWRCHAGHEWRATVHSRNRGARCPFCSGRLATPERNLSAGQPGIAAEWHPLRNGALRPEDVTPHSNRKVWWRCTCGHEWRATVANRTRGAGCPRCARQ